MPCPQGRAAEGEQGQAGRGGSAVVRRTLPVDCPVQRPLEPGPAIALPLHHLCPTQAASSGTISLKPSFTFGITCP